MQGSGPPRAHHVSGEESGRGAAGHGSTREGVVELSAALNRHGAAWTEVARVEARGAGGLEQAPCESGKLDNTELEVGMWGEDMPGCGGCAMDLGTPDRPDPWQGHL